MINQDIGSAAGSANSSRRYGGTAGCENREGQTFGDVGVVREVRGPMSGAAAAGLAWVRALHKGSPMTATLQVEHGDASLLYH